MGIFSKRGGGGGGLPNPKLLFSLYSPIEDAKKIMLFHFYSMLVELEI